MPRPTAGAETQKEAEGRAYFPAEQLCHLGSHILPGMLLSLTHSKQWLRGLVPVLQWLTRESIFLAAHVKHGCALTKFYLYKRATGWTGPMGFGWLFLLQAKSSILL